MKKLLIIITIIIIITAIALTILYFRYKELIDYIDQGNKFEYKIFYSPKNLNKLTLFVQIKGDLSHYDSFIYLVDGEYTKKALPERDYVKFPSDTGVSLNWDNENLCSVTIDKKPDVNILSPQKFKVNLSVDRKRIEQLTSEGKVYRYSTKPFRPDKE